MSQKTEFILVSTLVLSDELQARDALPGVEEYAEVIKPCKAKAWPEDMPPIKVIQVADEDAPEGPGLYVTDGFMRTGACQHLRRRYVKARVKQGTWQEARAEAQGANMEHGYRLSNKEIRRNIKRALDDGCSVTEAANRCKVHRQTIYNYLERMTGKKKPEQEAKEIEEQDEAKVEADACKHCRCRWYVDTPDGYCCEQCGAPEGSEPEDKPVNSKKMRGETLEERRAAAEEPFKKAESARGKLIRELDEIGILSSVEGELSKIFTAIDNAKAQALKNVTA